MFHTHPTFPLTDLSFKLNSIGGFALYLEGSLRYGKTFRRFRIQKVVVHEDVKD